YQRECIQLMIREVQRLERILSTLIDYNKPEPVKPESLDPNRLIEQVLHLNEEQFDEKELTLEVDLGDEMGEVFLDPARFQHVIRNLVANAIEASPRGGVIRVETGVFVPSTKAQETGSLESDTYFEMKIRNRGPVIPPDEIEKIFDPFFSTKDHGSGLGLTLSKKIVEEHHGSVGVKSDSAGTVFSVWIPLAHGRHDDAAGPQAKMTVGSG
ncbi:MAG: ATP-binding protein, partial [Deltaproteobacteria bacterium]